MNIIVLEAMVACVPLAIVVLMLVHEAVYLPRPAPHPWLR